LIAVKTLKIVQLSDESHIIWWN